MTTNICMWTRVYISVQRSLCVAFPFKFKDIITKKVTSIVLMIIVMISIALIVPALCGFRFRLYWDNERNASLPCVDFTENNFALRSISILCINSLMIISFVTLIVSTIVLIVSLKKNANRRLRSGLADVDNMSKSTAKEKRIIKIVVISSAIFLACNIPGILSGFLYVLISNLSVDNGVDI